MSIFLNEALSISRVIILVLSLFLSGCAEMMFSASLASTFRTNEANQGAIQLLPTPVHDSSKAVFTLVRKNKYAQYSVNYTILQNGRVIGLLKPGSYLKWEGEPGEITLSYGAKAPKKCFGNKVPCVSTAEDILDNGVRHKPGDLKFTANKGEQYDFRFESYWFLLPDVPWYSDIVLVNDIDLTNINPPIYLKVEK